MSPKSEKGKSVGTPRPGSIATKRKNSDDDYYVEETLLFTYQTHNEDGSSPFETLDSEGNDPSSPIKLRSPVNLETFESMLQSVDDLRESLLIEIHHCVKLRNEDDSDNSEENDSDEDGLLDSDNEEIIERDKQVLKLMMSNEYPDLEIDKLLEAFKLTGGSFNNDILNGEFIENDIRLSEAIRDAIEEIKIVQKPNSSKSAE